MGKDFRKELFLHINGIVVIPTLRTLFDLEIFNFMNKNTSFSLDSLIQEFNVNPGYMNVSLRTLQSIGLIYKKNYEQPINNIFYVNKENLEIINSLSKEIKLCNNLANSIIPFQKNIYENTNIDLELLKLLNEYNDFLIKINNNIDGNEFKKNLNYYIIGSVLGTIVSNLGFLNIEIHKFKSKNKDLDLIISSIFKNIFLLDSDNRLTSKGLFYNDRATSFGVTTSYMPLLKNLKNILTINSNFIRELNENKDEKHVNRNMNVWGSGGAHKYYFNKIDNIIIDIFNRNIEDQPKGIIDIGCGDGTFLKHCYDLISNKTIRKNYLKDHPIILIGVDINKAARVATRKKLNSVDIENIVINGNISDPDSINKTISNEFNVKLEDFINTRTFLDHNRIYTSPKELKFSVVQSSGVFASKGKIINSESLLNNLIEHFSNWKKYIYKYGLIILELHTINPKDTAENQGRMLSCSYDATHGYSDQYLVEYDIFIKCANLANMKLNDESILFPNKEYPTISINYFT